MKGIRLMSGIAILLFLAGCGVQSTGCPSTADSTSSGANPVPYDYGDLDPTQRSWPAVQRIFTLPSINGTISPQARRSASALRRPPHVRQHYAIGRLHPCLPHLLPSPPGTVAVTVYDLILRPASGTSNAVNFIITSGTSGTCAGGVNPQSITVDLTGKFAYVANGGCPDDFNGSVSMYTINPTDGTLTSAGPDVSSGDFNPVSVAVDPSGKFTYVANWGDGEHGG